MSLENFGVSPKFKATKKGLSITLHLDNNHLLALNVLIGSLNASMCDSVINVRNTVINNVSIASLTPVCNNIVINLA